MKGKCGLRVFQDFCGLMTMNTYKNPTLILKFSQHLKCLPHNIGVGPGFILKAHGNYQSSRNNNSTLLEKYRKSFQPDALQHWGHHESLAVKETSQHLRGKKGIITSPNTSSCIRNNSCSRKKKRANKMFKLHSFIDFLLPYVINKTLQSNLQCKVLAWTVFLLVCNLNFKKFWGIVNLTKSFKN